MFVSLIYYNLYLLVALEISCYDDFHDDLSDSIKRSTKWTAIGKVLGLPLHSESCPELSLDIPKCLDVFLISRTRTHAMRRSSNVIGLPLGLFFPHSR
jgi:hypothetical protein